MALKKQPRFVTAIVYVLLLAGIAWQAKAVAQLFGPGGRFPQVRSHRVSVSGEVRRPGVYRVPEGTTHFEILKTAGVRPTSDLSGINLMSAVDQSRDINVGSREQPVALKTQPISVRLEFFYGEVEVTAKDGRTLPTKEGMVLNDGDGIQTESSTQAEFSVGSFSRVDVDNFSELTFDNMGGREGDRTVVSMFQKAGSCWYRVAYAEKAERYRILTPAVTITVGGKGADFLVDIRADQLSIDLIEGLLLVEKNGGGESVNLISGQTASIYKDARPFQITRLAHDISASERFAQLLQGKKAMTAKNLPFNFLFCGTPAVFFMTSVYFDRGIVYTIHIPPRLFIGQFAEGMATFDEAYLHGGPVFVNSLLERIMNVRLSRYCIFTKDNIIKTADILGGITATIDAKAAAQFGTTAGPHRFSSRELVSYLNPANSSPEESQLRQRQVLNSIFEGLRSKTMVLTTPTIEQVLAFVESNVDAAEAMAYYLRFTVSGNWTRKDVDLPVQENHEKGRIIYEPVLDRCRTLLESN